MKLCLIKFAAVAVLLSANVFAEVADTVFVNGNIYTSNERAPWASAVALLGERIVFVGEDEDAAAFIGAGTRQHNLEGRLVLPGLIDAHTHPGMVAISVGQVAIDYVHDKESLLQAVSDMVDANPDRDILMGGFWSNDIFDERGPDKYSLDRIEPDRPIILYDDWGHSVWANSKALEIAGVDRNTRDIVPGFSFYQRDEHGEPTGWIAESAASVFVNNFQSVTPVVEQNLLEFLTYLRDLGVTTLLDAGNFGLDDQTYAAVSRLDKAGKLPIRYHGSFALFLPDDYSTAIDQLKELNKKYGSERVRIDTLKIFHDGVIETRTADMFDDYLDTPGNSGSSLLQQEQLHQLILELSKEKFNLHVHSVGNKSTNTLLNAIEQAHDTLSGPPPITISICHLEVVRETDFNRFKDLGVIASFTPQWHGAGGDAGLGPAIGDAAHAMMRAQPMISDGAVVTFSSDITDEFGWKGENANPYLGMQVGHNRQDVDGGPDAPYSNPRSERLKLDALVDGYTIHAAFALGRTAELGSIAVGKRADMVILDQNLFEVNRYDIHKTRPVAVIMDGEIVSGTLF